MKIIVGIAGFIWKLYVGLIFVITAILLYPVIAPFLASETGKKRAFRMFVFWSRLFRMLCFYGVKRVKNADLPKGPYLIVANHASYLDIFLMYSILPGHPFLFLGKSEILKYPLIKTYFKKMNIPVFRDSRIKAAKSLMQAAKEVHNGWSIMIFPEGGIPDRDHPRLIPFKQGAFRMAKSLDIPIVPITYTNNYRLFSDPTNLLGPAHPGISKVYIHPFISSEEIGSMTQNELRLKCFEIINGPIVETHPELNQ